MYFQKFCDGVGQLGWRVIPIEHVVFLKTYKGNLRLAIFLKED